MFFIDDIGDFIYDAHEYKDYYKVYSGITVFWKNKSYTSRNWNFMAKDCIMVIHYDNNYK